MLDEVSPGSSLLLSCEHATHWIPRKYLHLFVAAEDVIPSHRGWDPGALEAAERWQHKFSCPLFKGSINRLLIELNRSRSHSQLWSEFSCNLSEEEKGELLQRYYEPYRSDVSDCIQRITVCSGHAMHLSIHSLAPELNGRKRSFDVALLYDPDRVSESAICQRWLQNMLEMDSTIRVVENIPYRGIDDGLVESLRRELSPESYIGLEVEYNQGLLSNPLRWQRVIDVSIDAFYSATS